MAGKGLLIAVYGPEGVGKHTQVALLEEKLGGQSILSKSIRYPIYDLEPTGPKLDELLHRNKQRLPEEEMQKLFAQNRTDFQPTLVSWLDSGVTVLAQNYVGTGMVWGTLRGLEIEKIEEMNKECIEADVSILLDGPRRDGMDQDHPYGDEDEWYKTRKIYLQMADRYGWVRVGGDAPTLTVANRIWAIVRPVLVAR